MVGKPDPMMMHGFPKETTFSPYLVLRNTAEKPLEVSLQLNYMMGMDGSAPVTRNLPPQHLGPFEARQVDMQTALNSSGLKGFNGSINLSTSFTGKAGELVLAAGSVDQTGTYVFEVEPESVGSFRSKNTSYWGVASGNDTMFTLWNPTSTTQDILVTLYYGDGSGKYNLPVPLGPQASTMIDMAMLIAEHKPDPDGNVIPSNIQEGSAQFASAKGRNETITLVIAAGIYNVSTATCNGSCITCCGASNFGITPNPIYCPIGESIQCGSTAVDCNGYGVAPSSWSSDNTAVITVSGSGLVTGVSVGSANITAFFGNVTPYSGQICGGPTSCPGSSPAPGAPATVQVPTSLNVLSDTKVIDMSYGGVGCSNSGSYGIEIAIHYQVLDQNGAAMQATSMEPQEKDPVLGINNWSDIGPSNYPGTSQFTDANGQFWDAPLGTCSLGAFTLTDTQYISILQNGTRYPSSGGVRTNNWSTSSSSVGHGSIANGVDVSKSR